MNVARNLEGYTRARTLTPQQQTFVDFLQLGLNPVQAAEKMGFSGVEAFREARSLVRSPAVQMQVMAEAGADLRTVGVASAVKTLIALVSKDSATDKVKLEAAKALLDRAGYGSSTHAQPQGERDERPLGEMTAAELRDAIVRLERDLASRAKPVNSPDSLPNANEMLD